MSPLVFSRALAQTAALLIITEQHIRIYILTYINYNLNYTTAYTGPLDTSDHISRSPLGE